MLVPTAVKQKVCFYRMKAKQSQLCCEGTALMATPPSANVWEKLKYRIKSPETQREPELTTCLNINVRDNHVHSAALKPPPPFSEGPLQLFHLNWKMLGASTLKKAFLYFMKSLWEKLRAGQEPCKHLSSTAPLHSTPSCGICLAPVPWTMASGRISVNALWTSPYIWSKMIWERALKYTLRLPKSSSQNGNVFSSERIHSAAVSQWYLVWKERRR